jgi:Ankyrin repeat
MLRESDPLAVEATAAIRRGDDATLRHLLAAHPGLATESVAGAHGPARTLLHIAASVDDADVAAALIDAGADPDAEDGLVGTPLDAAIGYGCWAVARLLVRRGARVDKLWHAAALGMHDRLIDLLADSSSCDGALTEAFFLACGGGHAAAGLDAHRQLLVEWLRDHRYLD